MAELTPDELDRLEDALEEITGPDRVTDLDGLDLPPELVEHAAAYVEVLDAVAPHLASVAPSEGVLDGVLAEAREASRAVGVTAPPPVASEGRSSGRRGGWRRWWLPAVSLGGVCAGVFFLVTPEAALEDQAGTAPPALESAVATRVNEEDQEGPGAAVPTPSGEPTAAPGEGDLGTPGDDGVDALRSKGYGGLGVKLKENSGDAEGSVESEAKVAPTSEGGAARNGGVGARTRAEVERRRRSVKIGPRIPAGPPPRRRHDPRARRARSESPRPPLRMKSRRWISTLIPRRRGMRRSPRHTPRFDLEPARARSTATESCSDPSRATRRAASSSRASRAGWGSLRAPRSAQVGRVRVRTRPEARRGDRRVDQQPPRQRQVGVREGPVSGLRRLGTTLVWGREAVPSFVGSPLAVART